MNPGVLRSLCVVRGMVCLALQQMRCLPSGFSRGGATSGLFFPSKEIDWMKCLFIVGRKIHFFLHHFHFTFEVSDFCSPFGTTQPAFPSWIPHCESGTSIFLLVTFCLSSLSNSPSLASLTAASSTPCRRNGLSTWALRTPSWRLTMADSRTFSRISLRSEKKHWIYQCLWHACYLRTSTVCFLWARVAV